MSTARTLAIASADRLASTQAHLHEALACHDVVRLGAPERVVARLRRLAGRLEGSLGDPYAGHAVALADDDGDALAEVADAFARHGLELFAAEASEAYRQSGTSTRSMALAGRSRELAVSERTVHNHLHRAYTKLGVRSRRQLRSVLP